VKENPRRAFSIGEKKILKRDHFFRQLDWGSNQLGGNLEDTFRTRTWSFKRHRKWNVSSI